MVEKITLCWLDGFNQYRSRTIKRKIRPIPNGVGFHSAKGWPLHYTHMITYYGEQVPAHTDEGGQWWAFAD